MVDRQPLRHGAAHRVAGQHEALEAEVLRQSRDVGGEALHAVGPCAPAEPPGSAQVDRDDPMAFC